MSVRSAQAITIEFTTSSPTTQAATNADSLPVGTLVVNGTDNGASVTVTNVDTGRYKAAVTLPTLAVGDVVELSVAATVGTVAGKAIVWRDTKDVVIDSAGLVDANAVKAGPTGAGVAWNANTTTHLNQIYDTDYATVYDSTNKAFQAKLGNFAMGGSSLALTTGAIACTTITASGAVAFQSTFAVTGALTLSAGLAVNQSTTDGHGINVSGNGAGDAIKLTGGTTGHGLEAIGGTGASAVSLVGMTTGHGLEIIAGASGNGVTITGGSSSGRGVLITTVSGDGLAILPTAGHAIIATANGTSKHGLFVTGGTAGTSDGLKAVAGTGGVPIRGDLTGNIHGTLDVLTTYTNDTPQTGDSYAVVNSGTFGNAAIKTDTGNLVTRITATLFSGITSLAQWLGLLAGKQVGNSTARTEMRATGAGSGTFDETLDSLEALRGRGDAAWAVPSHFVNSMFDSDGVYGAAALANGPSGGGGGGPTAVQIRQEIDANSTQLAAVRAKTDNLPASPASTTNITAGTITTVTTLTSLPAAPTDWLTASGVSAAAADKIADHARRRTQANVEASSDGDALSLHSGYGQIQMQQKAGPIAGLTLTIYKTDGTTSLGTVTFTASAGANPITGVS